MPHLAAPGMSLLTFILMFHALCTTADWLDLERGISEIPWSWTQKLGDLLN